MNSLSNLYQLSSNRASAGMGGYPSPIYGGQVHAVGGGGNGQVHSMPFGYAPPQPIGVSGGMGSYPGMPPMNPVGGQPIDSPMSYMPPMRPVGPATGGMGNYPNINPVGGQNGMFGGYPGFPQMNPVGPANGGMGSGYARMNPSAGMDNLQNLMMLQGRY